MKRDGLKIARNWLKLANGKPLIVRGARRVGKTWLVRRLAKEKGRQLIEFNFEQEPLAAEQFDLKGPQPFLKSLEGDTGKRVEPESSLLFLDSVGGGAEALDKLIGLAEKIPELPVIVAGSFLDTNGRSTLPSDRQVKSINLEPLSFEEFLSACGHEALRKFLGEYELGEAIETQAHEILLELHSDYMRVGGMPEAVVCWSEGKSMEDCVKVHRSILETFRIDSSKYTGRIPLDRFARLLSSVPPMLGEKFKYTRVSGADRSAALKQALERLAQARLCCQVKASAARKLPLESDAREGFFKVIFADVGLASTALGAQRGVSPYEAADDPSASERPLAIQAIGQALRVLQVENPSPQLCYWARENKGSEAEVDYVFESHGRIVPIVLRAGATGKLRSLHLLMTERNLSLAVRINTEKPSVTSMKTRLSHVQKNDHCLVSLPCYLAGQVHRLIGDVSYV